MVCSTVQRIDAALSGPFQRNLLASPGAMPLLTPRVVVSGPVARVTDEPIKLYATVLRCSPVTVMLRVLQSETSTGGIVLWARAERRHVVCECVIIQRREVEQIRSETVILYSPNGDQQLKSSSASDRSLVSLLRDFGDGQMRYSAQSHGFLNRMSHEQSLQPRFLHQF